jgi:hypothetical protein
MQPPEEFCSEAGVVKTSLLSELLINGGRYIATEDPSPLTESARTLRLLGYNSKHPLKPPENRSASELQW